MHVGVKRVMEAKVQTLKSEFEAICMRNGESVDNFAMKLTTIVNGIHSLGDMVEEVSIIKRFLRAVLLRFMQIVTSMEQFGNLKNMLVEEVVACLKFHEERFHSYEDKEEEKYLLITHEEWLVRTKKNDATDSSFLDSSGHGNHNKGKKRSWMWPQMWWQRRS